MQKQRGRNCRSVCLYACQKQISFHRPTIIKLAIFSKQFCLMCRQDGKNSKCIVGRRPHGLAASLRVIKFLLLLLYDQLLDGQPAASAINSVFTSYSTTHDGSQVTYNANKIKSAHLPQSGPKNLKQSRPKNS